MERWGRPCRAALFLRAGVSYNLFQPLISREKTKIDEANELRGMRPWYLVRLIIEPDNFLCLVTHPPTDHTPRCAASNARLNQQAVGGVGAERENPPGYPIWRAMHARTSLLME